MSKLLSSTLTVLALGLLTVGCETAPKTPEERSALIDQSQSTLQQLKAQDPSLDNLINQSYAYAVFPSIGKGGAIVGGASGRGTVYEQGRFIGYTDMNQASVGAQLGGETYRELLVFQDKAALDRLRNNELNFGANASAVALKSGAAANARFENGVAVFTQPTGGLMAEASISGQKFNFVPAGEAPITEPTR